MMDANYVAYLHDNEKMRKDRRYEPQLYLPTGYRWVWHLMQQAWWPERIDTPYTLSVASETYWAS